VGLVRLPIFTSETSEVDLADLAIALLALRGASLAYGRFSYSSPGGCVNST
jgi:hypothetical protein